MRTLVIGKKIISAEVYEEWNKRYYSANTSNGSDKEERLNDLYDVLERDLGYLGSTAIEDLL